MGLLTAHRLVTQPVLGALEQALGEAPPSCKELTSAVDGEWRRLLQQAVDDSFDLAAACPLLAFRIWSIHDQAEAHHQPQGRRSRERERESRTLHTIISRLG